jgi:hypothetical protein
MGMTDMGARLSRARNLAPPRDLEATGPSLMRPLIPKVALL